MRPRIGRQPGIGGQQIGEVSLIFLVLSFIFSQILFVQGTWGQRSQARNSRAGGGVQVEVKAEVDRNQVEVGDPFTLTVSVELSSEGSGNQPKSPRLKSLRLGEPRLPPLGGLEFFHSWKESLSPGDSGKFSGGTSGGGSEGTSGDREVFVKKYHYQLAPRQKGGISIGPIRVVVDGREYWTKPLFIESLEVGAGPLAEPPVGLSPWGSAEGGPLSADGKVV